MEAGRIPLTDTALTEAATPLPVTAAVVGRPGTPWFFFTHANARACIYLFELACPEVDSDSHRRDVRNMDTAAFITGVLLLGSICWCQIAPYFGPSPSRARNRMSNPN